MVAKMTEEQKARVEYAYSKLKEAYSMLYDVHDLITDADTVTSDGLDVARESDDDDAIDFFKLVGDCIGDCVDLYDTISQAIESYEESLKERVEGK